MLISGSVVDSNTGRPIGGATVWSMATDQRSADVLGYADSAGGFSLVAPDNRQLMFAADKYVSALFSPYQVQESNVVQLDPENILTATMTLKIPQWMWILAGAVLVALSGKKQKRTYWRGDRYEHDKK